MDINAIFNEGKANVFDEEPQFDLKFHLSQNSDMEGLMNKLSCRSSDERPKCNGKAARLENKILGFESVEDTDAEKLLGNRCSDKTKSSTNM